MGEVTAYLEMGSKRVIASALEWPGWCRSARTEAQALAALLEAAPRYAEIARLAGLQFDLPAALTDLVVAHRLAGSAGTDYGVPELAPPGDAEPMNEAELQRAVALLRACWEAFDRGVAHAEGKELAKGPRGGGRELGGIQSHVLGAETAYGGRIGLKLREVEPGDAAGTAAHRQAMLDGLVSIAPLGALPPGPRGGSRWPARYFVRRVAYHVVEHLWEIEDRVAG